MKQTYTDRDYFEEKFSNIQGEFGNYGEKLDHLTKIIEGNGKPGLISRVSAVEDRQKSVTAWTGGALWVFGGVVGVFGFMWLRYGLPFIEQVSAHITGR